MLLKAKEREKKVFSKSIYSTYICVECYITTINVSPILLFAYQYRNCVKTAKLTTVSHFSQHEPELELVSLILNAPLTV